AEFPVGGSSGSGGGAVARRERNPLTGARAAELVREVAAASPWGTGRPPYRVSVTGGEPLVYPGFIADLGVALGVEWAVHLETAALDPSALARVLPHVAHVSADWKLPETLHGGADHGAAHAACVAAAVAAGRSVDVKVVLTAAVREASFAAALAALQP